MVLLRLRGRRGGPHSAERNVTDDKSREGGGTEELEMEHGPMTLQRLRSGRWPGWGIRFFLTAALTASQTVGSYAPFALGCVAAAGPGADGAAALLGGVAGALLFMEFSRVLAFAAVGVLVLTAVTAFQDTALLRRGWVLPVLSAVMVLAVEGIYVTQSLSPEDELTPCAAAAILTGVSAHFLRSLFRPSDDRLAPEGLLFLGAALTLALGDLTLGGASIGRALLCALLVCTAYGHGPLSGVTAGLGLGLMTDLSAGSSGLFTAAYGVAGLLAAQCRRRSMAAPAFFLGALAAMLTSRETLAVMLLTETAAGAVLFLLIPARAFGGKRMRREAPSDAGERRVLRERLGQAAEALRALYDSMSRTAPETEENPAVVFDRAAERVCRGCALCELCWQREYTATFNAMNDATPFLLDRGTARAKDFPQHFADRCIHFTELLQAINGELSAFLLRKQYRRQLEETRRSAKGQYAQLSDLLTAAAAGLDAAPAFGGEQDCVVGAALRPREGEVICGDTIDAFRTDDGSRCLLLADGMGSGEEARRESALTCRLLRQFLEAGIAPEAALTTLNSAMALRGAETGSFTTVDLCILRGDRAAFYKYGAAPSYLKKNGIVRRVTGSSLPVGLRGTPAAPDVTTAALEPGGFVVMVSDGVADPGRDEWLQNLLAGWGGDDPQTLANLILSESIRRERLQDDCAVQVLYRRPDGEGAV